MPASLVRAATIDRCAVRAVVTVENLASFSELAPFARPATLGVIYTGGFASPVLIAFLKQLRATFPAIPLFHWGDLDVGGLRILAHLRKELGEVAGLAMDRETFARYAGFARGLNGRERAVLGGLLTQDTFGDCLFRCAKRVIQTMLSADKKLEQEIVPIEYVLAQLDKFLKGG